MIDETDDDWMMYVMNTNLGGPMRYIREALKIFLPKNDGVYHQCFLPSTAPDPSAELHILPQRAL